MTDKKRDDMVKDMEQLTDDCLGDMADKPIETRDFVMVMAEVWHIIEGKITRLAVATWVILLVMFWLIIKKL